MDQETFTLLADRYMDMVFRLARSWLRSPQDADDVTQEVFLRLLRSDIRFEGDEHARRWLARVTVNEARRLCRSPWRRRTVPLDEHQPEEKFNKEEQRALFDAVMELPGKYRVPLHLYYYEGYAVKEVAEMLGRSPSTVQTQLARAREQLKKKLKEDWSND